MSKLKIFIVIFIGLSIPLYVLWKIVLVDFDYSSISAAQSGVKITSQTINNQELLVFPEEENYFFDKINLVLKPNKAFINRDRGKILAYQNFLVSFYPQIEDALNKTELKNLLFEGNSTDLPAGSLFFNGDSISIMLPNNTYRSIFSAELFEKMGYQWKDVVDKKIGFAGGLQELESFLYGDAHPNGTFIEVNGKYLLVWDQKLFPLETGIDPKNFSQTSPIKINTLKPEPFDNCNLISNKNELICNLTKEINSTKSNYIFITSDLKSDEIQEIKLNLSTTPSQKSFKNNFLVSIDNIKLKLIKKYRGYIPFI